MSQEIEAKKAALETLRLGFMGLMNIVMQSKSSMVQKQQALLRFDEGHMWLQNGIMSYVEPEAPKPMTDVPASEQPMPEHHAVCPNGANQQQEQIAVA